MKAKQPKLFYVPDTPDNEEIDISKTKRVSEEDFFRLLKASKKVAKAKSTRKKAA